MHVRRALDSESLEPFDLVRVVDADGDPELAGMALSGTLHRLADGTDLAETFVYHSRAAQALVLVVPAAVRHREVSARHELMDQLETLPDVPEYAFDFRVVMDAAGLRAALTRRRPTRPPPLIESVSDDELDELPETSPELTPELLSHLATDVVDDAEAATLEEVEELPADAGVEELPDASDVSEDTHPSPVNSGDTHPSPGAAVAASEDTHPITASDDDISEVDASEDASEDTHPIPASDDDISEVDASEVELHTSAGVGVPGRETSEDQTGVPGSETSEDTHQVVEAEAVQLVEEDPGARGQSLLDGTSGEFALVDADWVTTYTEDIEDDAEAVTLDDDDLVAVPESYSTLTELPRELPAGVAPPADFERDARRLRAGLFKGRVWLFARTRPGIFERDGIDVAVQHAAVGGRSVAFVSLGDLTADRSETLRLATDLGSPSPRALFAALSKDFVISVAFFHEGRAPVRCVTLRSAREANVARILALPTAPAEGAVDAETAVARALAAPPPLDSTEHPFQVRRAGATAGELRTEVRNVARWLEPTRRDRVRLGLGVPEPVIQHVCEAVYADAVRKGIALPPALMLWAVSRGLAESPAEIVSKQLTSFLALASEPDRGGLRDGDVVSNWNALRGAASAFAVELPPAIAEVLRAMDSEDEARDPGALEALNVAALLELLRHANHRSGAAIELLRRDPALHADAVGVALRDMRREEVVILVPALARAGDPMVPALLETLAAKKTFVRQAAALTLASLQAEDAIPGLLALVAKESTSLWEEFARALAAFGELAEAALVDAITQDAIPDDRAALVLAYLAKGGFAGSVEELTRSPNLRVAVVASSVGPRMPVVEQHLREFYDASTTPTGPREFGKKLFRALHPDSPR